MQISVRVSIVTALSMLILISSATIITISYVMGSKSVNNLSDNLISMVSESIVESTIDYLDPADRSVVMGRKLINNRLISKTEAYNPVPGDQDYQHTMQMVDKIARHYEKSILDHYQLSQEDLKKLLFNKIIKMTQIANYFFDLLDTYEQIVMMDYGDNIKDSMTVKKMPDKTVSTRYVLRFRYKEQDIAITAWDHKTEVYYSGKEEEHYKNNIQLSREAYDPTQRSWFKGAKGNFASAVKKGRKPDVFWTPAYVFPSDHRPGISCAVPIAKKNRKEMDYVISAGLGINDMSKYLETLTISQNSNVFIIDEADNLLAHAETAEEGKKHGEEHGTHGNKETPKQDDPRDSKESGHGHGIKLTPLKEHKLYATAFEVSKGVPAKLKDGKRVKKFTFSYNATPYIGAFSTFPKGSYMNWTIGIVIPEDDFLGSVKANTYISLAVSIVTLFLSLFIGMYFASRISKPLQALVKETEKIREFRLEDSVEIKTNFKDLSIMGDAFQNMKLGLRSFKKYVSSDLVRYLIQSGQEAILGGEKMTLTVYFSDIADFTSISESLAPEALVRDLGEYLGEMSNIITVNEGTIDKYIGDAIMAFWGAPKECADHAFLACKSAIENQQKLELLRKTKWKNENKPLFKARIGVNTGDLIVGNIGSDIRMDYTVIGDTVNLASRLEGINKYYKTEIMCSESTNQIVKDRIVTRKLDLVTVKGKAEAVGIYEIVGFKNQVSVKLESFIAKYEEAFDHYLNRRFEEALRLFKDSLSLKPGDAGVSIFAERCENYINQPPAEDWNGVYVFKTK
ncbi:MAG: adenylate/guanylate cyclase domain-containing protein [bacterium]|nr:MAG: adenylate/guanylate cyclase domain-containing protein [bacterium]